MTTRTTSKKPRNSPDARVHDETQERVSAHDENTDRDEDDLYSLEAESEITEWRRTNDLDAPPSRPGYVQRFIRVRLGDERDLARLKAAGNRGWMPRKSSTCKASTLPTIRLDQYGDVIGAGDLVLCERPQKIDDQRNAFYKNKNARQNVAIERNLHDVSGSSNVAGFGPITQQRNTRAVVPPRRERIAVADDD